MLNGPELPMMVLFVSIAAVFIMRGPFGRAMADRLSGRARTGSEDQDLRELKDLTEQMSELGERVDFLERLVAKQREAERLPPVR